MKTIKLKFDTINEPIEIVPEKNKNAKFFWQNIKSFNRPADSIFSPPSNIEIKEQFLQHAVRANEIFGFNWDLNNLSQENFNLWHRDIEAFDWNNPHKYTQGNLNLAIELHQWLHTAEYNGDLNKPKKNKNIGNISVKWFSKSLPWPNKPVFVDYHEILPGDIVTDYPHVGKTPLTSCLNNDTTHLFQSCKLPDTCPPSFHISLTHRMNQAKNDKLKKRTIKWYRENIDQLGNMFSLEQMLAYFGEYRVGRLKNLDQIPLLQTNPLNSVIII